MRSAAETSDKAANALKRLNLQAGQPKMAMLGKPKTSAHRTAPQVQHTELRQIFLLCIVLQHVRLVVGTLHMHCCHSHP